MLPVQKLPAGVADGSVDASDLAAAYAAGPPVLSAGALLHALPMIPYALDRVARAGPNSVR